jgi:hypothetical protein
MRELKDSFMDKVAIQKNYLYKFFRTLYDKKRLGKWGIFRSV